MASEACAYWLTREPFVGIKQQVHAKDVVGLSKTLTDGKPVPTDGASVDSVFIADFISSLELIGVSFPKGIGVGNRGRGFPGTILIRLDRQVAARVVRSLEEGVKRIGYEGIANAEPLNVFVENAKQVEQGIEYLQRALSIPEGYEGVVIRLN